MIELYTRVGTKLFQREDPFFQYPGGEWDMKEAKEFVGNEVAYIQGTDLNDYIKGQFWWHACATYSKYTSKHKNSIDLVVPYLPAARGDKGIPNGSEIYANLLPRYDRLVTLDVHSDHMIDYLASTSHEKSKIINITAKDVLSSFFDDLEHYDGIVAPDEGAVERARQVAHHFDLPLFIARKKRDFETGKLLNFIPPDNVAEMREFGNYLIVDDICDGGGTFIGLAEALANAGYTGRLDLYVTHGIFSKGLKELSNKFNIITTNSLPQNHSDTVLKPTVINVKNLLLSKVTE